MYFFKLLLLESLFLVLPSRRAILPFISCLSISQAFRSLSCRCHSVWRKRITPMIIPSVPIHSQPPPPQSIQISRTLKGILGTLRLICLLRILTTAITSPIGAGRAHTGHRLPSHGNKAGRKPLYTPTSSAQTLILPPCSMGMSIWDSTRFLAQIREVLKVRKGWRNQLLMVVGWVVARRK